MQLSDLKDLIQYIVTQAYEITNTLSDETAPVNYACIFSQNDKEFNTLLDVVQEISIKIIIDTATGPIFQIISLPTIAGDLQLLKIRKPDFKRLEKGDADFTLKNYSEFKKNHLSKKGYKLIERETFEMIEYKNPKYNVLVYFSHPPLDEQLGLI